LTTLPFALSRNSAIIPLSSPLKLKDL